MWKIVAVVVHLNSPTVTYYSPTDRFAYQEQCLEAVRAYQGHKAEIEAIANSYYKHKTRVTLKCNLDRPGA